MAEQQPICARIRFNANLTHGIIGKGNVLANALEALRAYFSDGSKPHYWVVDDSIPGGSYNLTTNLSPLNSGTTFYNTLVLKPHSSASGGTSQRIVIMANGNFNPAASASWGGMRMGYLPDGAFDPTDGVKCNASLQLDNPPPGWSLMREMGGDTQIPAFVRDTISVIEYRDDPSIHSDPGQSICVLIDSYRTIDDYERNGTRTRIPALFSKEAAYNQNVWLGGRIIQPFTRYHELAIGNRGDGVMAGFLGTSPTISSRPQFLGGWDVSTSEARLHSSILRVAPNCWHYAHVNWGGVGTGWLSAAIGAYTLSVGTNRQPIPFTVAGWQRLAVRNGTFASGAAAGDTGTYGYHKYVRCVEDLSSGFDNTWMSSTDPTSSRAWYAPQAFTNIARKRSELLLFNKAGWQDYDYLQI